MNYFHRTAGQVSPGLADLHALADAQAAQARKRRNDRHAHLLLSADFAIADQGTLVLFNPLTPEAKAWIDNNCVTEPYQWFGRALAVNHSCAQALYDGIINDGLTVK